MRILKFTVTGSRGEYEHELPAKLEVCPGCEGEGTRLHEAIGSHAYSREEFEESFDEEEREEYFKRGGRYDVQCTDCHGERVVPVVDEDECNRTHRNRKLLKLYEQVEERRAEWARQEAHERRMGY